MAPLPTLLQQARESAAAGDRLDTLLGPASGLIHPLRGLLAGAILWIPLASLSGRPLAMAWSCWSLVLLLTALWLERPWINRMPLPPITVITLAGFIRWGLGAGLLAWTADQAPAPLQGWAIAVEPAQALWGIVSTAIVLAGLLNRPLLLRLQPLPLSPAMQRRLPLLVLVTGLFTCAYLITGMGSGTLDRSSANYLFWTTKLWRADTLFVPFLRLRNLFPLLAPLAVLLCLRSCPAGAAWSRRALAGVLIVLTLLSLALGAMSGGRALLIFPLLLLLGGLWMTDLPASLLRWLALALVLFGLVFIPLMAGLRDSPAFQATHSQDVMGRAAVIGKAMVQARPEAGSIALIGRELFPSSDPFLFHPPGSQLPPAGNRGLKGLLYLWVPKHLKPDRPEINDGHLIAKEVMGESKVGVVNGTHVWFPNMSFGGDLYRRYRWPGVIVGSLAFGLFYALMARIWYQTASLSASLFQLLLAVYPASFIDGLPLRSVSETVWNWFWELPKYLLVLVVLAWLIEGLYRIVHRSSLIGEHG
ncbi:MAG: hypothetical protein ACKO5F_04645 [Synechococcus sp.]